MHTSNAGSVRIRSRQSLKSMPPACHISLKSASKRRTSLTPFIQFIAQKQLAAKGQLRSIDSTQFDQLHNEFKQQQHDEEGNADTISKKRLRYDLDLDSSITSKKIILNRREQARRRSTLRKQQNKRVTQRRPVKYYPERLRQTEEKLEEKLERKIVPFDKSNISIWQRINLSVNAATAISQQNIGNFSLEALEDFADKLEMFAGVRDVPTPLMRLQKASNVFSAENGVYASTKTLEELANTLEDLIDKN